MPCSVLLGEVHLRVGCVEDHEDVFVHPVTPAVGIELHHNQPGNLVGAGVEEGEVLLNLSLTSPCGRDPSCSGSAADR